MYEYRVNILKVIDGDTVDVDIDWIQYLDQKKD